MAQHDMENENIVENETKKTNEIDKTQKIDSGEEYAILGAPPKSNRVIVRQIKNKTGLRSYLIRARRILRLQNNCVVISTNACNIACEIVEILKKERVAEIQKIRTTLIENNQSEEDGQPALEIALIRGEFGHLVSDFRRRKVIEVFEIHDSNLTGIINGDKIRQLNPVKLFRADNVRKLKAEEFLKKHNDQLDLPAWIHYCSILIHPLLLEYHFKTAIEHFGGVVDVHPGSLPSKMSEEQISQLQRMGLYDDEKQENIMDLNTFDLTFNRSNGQQKNDDINTVDEDNNIENDNGLIGTSNTNKNNVDNE